MKKKARKSERETKKDKGECKQREISRVKWRLSEGKKWSETGAE